MNVYKLNTGACKIHTIDREIFERTTHRRPPYYKTNSDGTVSQFAVCPACDGPIQLISLYTASDSAPRPHGRHFTRSIPNLASYNQENYENCPYANPDKRHDKNNRRKDGTGVAKQILALLRDNFDYVLEIVSDETGIIITENLARSMLVNYLGERGNLYTGATLINVPWIFAYMSDSQSLYGRIIAEQSELAKCIRQGVNDIYLNERNQISKSGTGFLSINFCFIAHRTKLVENSLDERMTFVVSIEKNGKDSVFFEKEIRFDHDRFQKLIQIPASKTRRKEQFLRLAVENIPI